MIRPCRSTVASRSAAQSSAVTGKAVPKSRSGPRTSHRLTRRRRPNEAMLAALEVSPHAADDCDPPNVYNTRANGIYRAEAERMLSGWCVDAGTRTPSSDGEKRISASRRRALETTRRRTALNLAPMTSRQGRALRSDLEPQCGPNAGIEPCSSALDWRQVV